MPVRPADYMHPEDKAALDNLRSIPLFTQCVQSFMKVLPERMLHGQNMAQKVRLGPDQMPEIYQYIPPACAVLGIAEPEFYLEMNPSPNAYTYGDKQPAVTVTSALIEYMDEDEIAAVVAHECGHIACQHTLYHTMADLFIKAGAQIFGPLAALSMPVQMALMYWYRRSELSADRAAAVVMGGSPAVVDVMVRLAGGPRSITGKVNIDLYVKQADAYDKLMESRWDQLLQGLSGVQTDHPFPTIRTREIIKWCEGEHFQRLVEGLKAEATAVPADGPRCPNCHNPIQESWKFCFHCGNQLPERSVSIESVEATHE